MAGVCDSLADVLMPRSQVIRQRVGCVGGVLIAIGVVCLLVGWMDVVGGFETYGLFIDGARSVDGGRGSHLLGGKGLSDLSRHI